jgi:hypothetical protein
MRAKASLIALICLLLVPAGAASAKQRIRFAAAVNYPTGSDFGPGPAPVDMVAGDFNSDGWPDLVLCDWFGSSPLLMLNRGAGKFGAAQPIAGASAIDSLAIADLNRDRRPDLVGSTGSDLVVLLGRGDGSFRVGETYETQSNAQVQAIVLDVNADRLGDIAATTPNGIQTWIGRGDGTFKKGASSAVLGLLSGLAAARFDRDRFTDLAVLDAFPLMQKVIALKGKGDGTFTETGSGTTGYGPEAVMGGDLNTDGFTDMVTADSFGFTASVLISSGLGGFRKATAYDAGNGPVSVAIADFDRDGHKDFVSSAVASNAEYVYAGNRKGRFTSAGVYAVTRNPQTPVVADFDRDGRVDIAVAGPGQLSILRNIS